MEYFRERPWPNSTYAIKRLVNHKMNNDVTAGYIITDVERLREPMEKFSKCLQSYFQKTL